MRVKGVSIKSAQEFVRERFPERYEEWLDSLPEESRAIITGSPLISKWYPYEEGIEIPTKKICELFYQGELKGAWELGRYGAAERLSGVYRNFAASGSPNDFFARSKTILSLHYDPSLMIPIINEPGRIVLNITEFPGASHYSESRIGGWLEMVVEFFGKPNLKVGMPKSMANGDDITEFQLTWQE